MAMASRVSSPASAAARLSAATGRVQRLVLRLDGRLSGLKLG
jgi:hypothetical protein